MLVPRSVFHLHEVGDTEASRYALGGVRVCRAPDGTPRAVATDGLRLMAVTWEEDKPDEYPSLIGCEPGPNGGKFAVVVPKAACRKIPKLADEARKSAKPILARNVAVDEHAFDPQKAEDAQRIPVAATDLAEQETTVVRTLAGRFPKYEEIYPVSPDGLKGSISVRLNYRFLEDICRTMRKVLDDKDRDHPGVVLTVQGHDKAVYLTAGTARCQVAGVLMPIGTKEEKAPEPGWMPHRKPEGEPADFSIETALHVVADSWEALRKVDIERLLDGVPEEHRRDVAHAICEHRPELADRVAGILSALAHPSNQGPDPTPPPPADDRKPRLLKALEDLHQEIDGRFGRVGAWSDVLAEIRGNRERLQEVAADDAKSLDNFEQALFRLRRYLEPGPPVAPPTPELDGKTAKPKAKKGPYPVTGKGHFADHTAFEFRVIPKQSVELLVDRMGHMVGRTFTIGSPVFFDAAQNEAGRITTIGPKLVAVDDSQGKKHWLTMVDFAGLNRDNGKDA